MKIELPLSVIHRLEKVSAMIHSTPNDTLLYLLDTILKTYEESTAEMPDGSLLDLSEAEDEILNEKLRQFEEGEGWRRGKAGDETFDG